MTTVTIVITPAMRDRIERGVERVKPALQEVAGRKNAGKGELIRRALAAGLPIVLQELEEPGDQDFS